MYSTVEGNGIGPDVQEPRTTYSHMEDPLGVRTVPRVWAQCEPNGELVRVVPLARLGIMDALPVRESLDNLKPILPLVVEGDIINTDQYYCCVFQGRRVGIYKATV